MGHCCTVLSINSSIEVLQSLSIISGEKKASGPRKHSYPISKVKGLFVILPILIIIYKYIYSQYITITYPECFLNLLVKEYTFVISS